MAGNGNFIGGDHGNDSSNGELQRLQMLRAIKTQFYIHKSFDYQSDLEFLPAIANEFDGGLAKVNGGYHGLNSPRGHIVNPYQQMTGLTMNFNELMKASKNRGTHSHHIGGNQTHQIGKVNGNGNSNINSNSNSNEFGNGGGAGGGVSTGTGASNRIGNGNIPGGYRAQLLGLRMGTASPGQYYSAVGGVQYQQSSTQGQPQGQSLQGQGPAFNGAQRF